MHHVLDVVVEIGREALGTEAVVNLVARRVGAWPRRYGRWHTRRFVYLFQLMLRFPWGGSRLSFGICCTYDFRL